MNINPFSEFIGPLEHLERNALVRSPRPSSNHSFKPKRITRSLTSVWETNPVYPIVTYNFPTSVVTGIYYFELEETDRRFSLLSELYLVNQLNSQFREVNSNSQLLEGGGSVSSLSKPHILNTVQPCSYSIPTQKATVVS